MVPEKPWIGISRRSASKRRSFFLASTAAGVCPQSKAWKVLAE
jgi:hypothetical protein